MQSFDIAPYALPNHPQGELRFEEPRDIRRVVVSFGGTAPRRVGLSYLRKLWPHNRIEDSLYHAANRPARFGWRGMEDQFNSEWQKAAVRTSRLDGHTVAVTFQPVTREFPEFPGSADYDVTYRRTMGIRVDAPKGARVRRVQVFTCSGPCRTRLRVELDAARRTPGARISLSGYNALVERALAGRGARADGKAVRLGRAQKRSFQVDVRHMLPAHDWSFDDALVTFDLGKDAFTVSLTTLERQGPVWYAEQGVYVAREDDTTSFADYQARNSGAKTVIRQVQEHREQTLAGALHGQPRPHPDAFILGCKGVREYFWIEPNGDVVLPSFPLKVWPTERTKRFLNKGDGRFFLGLQRWCPAGRFNDPPPAMVYNIQLKKGDLLLEHKSLAVPLEGSLSAEGELQGDATLVGLVRLRVRNEGGRPALAELPVSYSADSGHAQCPLSSMIDPAGGQTDEMIPQSPRESLAAGRGRLTGIYKGHKVLRAAYVTTMKPRKCDAGVVFRQELEPGETCELLLKIPYISLESRAERAALDAREFDASYEEVKDYWRRVGGLGAGVRTPEPNLNAAYALHWPIVALSDPVMPDGTINTSVGTATYGNFANEACMIQQELDQRGLHEEARRRLDVYLASQGRNEVAGMFTDFEGLLFGPPGFEGSNSYVQAHGWVLCRLADHYFMTGDEAWLRGAADSLVAAADWVFRQRRSTMQDMPHSRGWEHGFLPAGGLEDVADFHYWLVNNAMSWRGTDSAARALAAIAHPEAARIARASRAYRRDLLRGFETARRHAPLVRLRDGRWVPNYPSRLYRRGRDMGWIRETLEGSVHLLLARLIDPGSRQAGWILDDYQDNRYMSPPHGYIIEDPEAAWFHQGGFSFQPNLLAGLVPHLDRDEPEVYIWMFFNAWASCYREEINAMVEHPMPQLGWSNTVPFKTSDQSNAMQWLVNMFVYAAGDTLHFGRAMPRYWLRDGEETGVEGVCTVFGSCGVTFRSEAAQGRIVAELRLDLRRRPRRVLVRFRHPEGKPVRSVTVNGRRKQVLDARKGDVQIDGRARNVRVVARF